jgi:antitoxin component YwqK of YwqJK toxin-antitoxin module
MSKDVQLQTRGTYVAGKADGPYESYYENGQLRLGGIGPTSRSNQQGEN